MNQVGIICKRGVTEPVDILIELLPWLEDRGMSVLLDADTAKMIGRRGHPPFKIPESVDLIIVLGGDGTMLSVARLSAGKNIPIFGINLGGLGFITEISKSEIFAVIEQVISGKCMVEERMMLSVRVIRDKSEIASYHVLNDVVINKGALARIFDIEMFIEHRYVTTFKADGLIFSTPTGSTAYCLSAGGPIVYPTLNAIVITPICSHTLNNRPIVIEDNMLVEAVIKSGQEDIYLTLDGQVGYHLREHDVIEIKKSEHKTKLLLPCARDYFQILREKLKWGER